MMMLKSEIDEEAASITMNAAPMQHSITMQSMDVKPTVNIVSDTVRVIPNSVVRPKPPQQQQTTIMTVRSSAPSPIAARPKRKQPTPSNAIVIEDSAPPEKKACWQLAPGNPNLNRRNIERYWLKQLVDLRMYEPMSTWCYEMFEVRCPGSMLEYFRGLRVDTAKPLNSLGEELLDIIFESERFSKCAFKLFSFFTNRQKNFWQKSRIVARIRAKYNRKDQD
jgi:hypothetical protein